MSNIPDEILAELAQISINFTEKKTKNLKQENKALKNKLAEFKALLVKFANNDRLNEFYNAESNKLDYIQNTIKALEDKGE